VGSNVRGGNAASALRLKSTSLPPVRTGTTVPEP